MDNKILTKLKPEVQLLVSTPTRATGNEMLERVLSLDELARKMQLTRLCDKAYFQHLVAAGKRYKFRPNGDDRRGTITLLCREQSISRYYPKAVALAAILEGTIIGRVLEVHVEKILDECGIEVSIPSIANPTHTPYVVISRETERFVNEIHDHKEELRSSHELLTELQGSGSSESYEERKGSSSNKETCASPFSNPPQRASLYTQRTVPTNEKKWKVIHAYSPDGGYSATAVSNIITQVLRHSDQEGRQTDGSRHWDTIRPILVKEFAQEEARDFDDWYWFFLIHEGSNKMRIEYLQGQ